MKIALLGPSQSGKTVYFSGLSYVYRNFVGFRPLSKGDRDFYHRERVDRRIALQLGFRNSVHEREINQHIALLAERPIREWPERTLDLDRASVSSEFYFTDAFDDEASVESYTRSIEIYDPPGGALGGLHDKSAEIVDDLCRCDVAMAFLPANLLLEAVETGDPERVLNGAYFGKIKEIILASASRIARHGHTDMLPVCIIMSKADLLQNLPENVIIDVREMLYDHVIKPFSRNNPNMTICVCPVSVFDPTSGNFEASNLEWPFMFAVAGTIFRNSLALRVDAEEAREAAEAAERAAEELKGGGWTWGRLRAWWNNDGVNARRKRAQAYYTSYGRLVSEAEDDRALAKSAWAALGVEGRARQVKIYAGGREFDPVMLGEKL